MKYADLHIHTNFSDGTFTPEQVVRQAQEKGLCCIAITDHDTVSAIEPAIKEAEKSNIELIPGVELTAEVNDCEIHLLGYFVNYQTQWFTDKLDQICAVRRRRALHIIEKLKNCGIDLDPEELMSEVSSGSIGRPHIASMMKKKGYVISLQEAFDKYIGNGCPCYVKKFKLTPAEAIEMIRKVGGLAVLAHPHYMGNDRLISEFARLGLKGIEVYYAEYNSAVTEHYQNLAKKYGLLITGGSDCHGQSEGRPKIGGVKIPYNLVEAMKKEIEILRNEQKSSC